MGSQPAPLLQKQNRARREPTQSERSAAQARSVSSTKLEVAPTEKKTAGKAPPIPRSLLSIPISPVQQGAERGPQARPKNRLSLQRKLAVGSINDPLEAEADAAAATIMSLPGALATNAAPATVPRIQRKSSGAIASSEATPGVHEVLRSPGHPLDSETRQFLEPRFGHDFSHVQIHHDSYAATSAAEMNAHAYTVGSHIVFGAGQYNPHSVAGRTLLAHELTHTVQQAAGSHLVQRQPAPQTAPATPTTAAPATTAPPENQELNQAIKAADWQKAAEILNGYNAAALLSVLQKLNRGISASIYVGAIENKRLGPTSAVAIFSKSFYLDINYDNELKRQDWKAAAEFLNGFSREDIEKHLSKLDLPTIQALHGGAIENKALGDQSDVAQLTEMHITRSKNVSTPTGQVLGADKATTYVGDPLRDPMYIENTTKMIGMPIWGGPFYLKQTVTTGWGDSVVVGREDVFYDQDPLSKLSIQLGTSIYPTREAALQAVKNSGYDGVYAFYWFAPGHIVPTIFSATTAPAVTQTMKLAREQERQDAKGMEKLSTGLLFWYIGARFPARVGGGGAAVTTEVAASSIQEVLGETEYAALKASAEAAKAANPALASLSIDEIIAIRAYSGESWAALNQALRLKDAKELTRLGQFINLMKSGLTKLPIFKGTVTRTIAMPIVEAAERYKVGATVIEDAFTSTTTGAGVAQREGNILLKIISESGRDISSVAVHAESEVLFSPGARFFVTEAKQIGSALLVTMKEVL